MYYVSLSPQYTAIRCTNYPHFSDEDTGVKSKSSELIQYVGGVNTRDNIQTSCSDFNTHAFGIWRI